MKNYKIINFTNFLKTRVWYKINYFLPLAFEHYESEDDDLKKEDISFSNNANLQANNPYRSISLTPGALLAQKRSETSQSRTSNSSLEVSASTIGKNTFQIYDHGATPIIRTGRGT